MDGYACSSWYLLRYTDPKNTHAAWNPDLVNYWSPVDYYVGGDHAVAHLLYVRFWTHVFNEMGLVNFKEPVKKLVFHGHINAEDGSKMSKSKGNVVDPLDVIDQGYGADALRTYLLFMGPLELDAPWDSKGIAGVYRFINRVWVLIQEFLASEKKSTKNDEALLRLTHKTIKKVTDDYKRLSFNTVVAALMEFTNELYKFKVDGFSEEQWKSSLSVLVQLIAPLAPHTADELWSQLDQQGFVQKSSWPVWDDKLAQDENITIVVQVNGKVRARLEVSKDEIEDNIKSLASADAHVAEYLEGKEIKKFIYVPGRLVSFVV
jgi:leucyl-tRNA synthetase